MVVKNGSGGLSRVAGRMSTLSQVFVCGRGMEEEAEVLKAKFFLLKSRYFSSYAHLPVI